MEKVFGKKNAERFEEIREDNYEPNPVNVLVADVFRTHYVHERDNKKLKKQFYYLHQVVQKEQVAEHPLLHETMKIQLPNRSWIRFRELVELCRIKAEMQANLFVTPEKCIQFINDIKPLCEINEEDFKKGVVSVGKRQERIGKYIMKLSKRHNELLAYELFIHEKLMEAKETFDTRKTESVAKVLFTSTPYALTHISTNTEWKTSCQRWKLLECTDQNYGLLGNLGGATMVAYVADERSDYDSSKWRARMLVRIGTKGDLFIEIPYTTRSEYSELHKLLAEALKEKGITAYYVGQKLEAKDFKSLPVKHFVPYNNSSSTITVKQNKNTYHFEGYGVEAVMEVMNKNLEAQVVPYVVETIKDMTELNKYVEVSLPKELLVDLGVVYEHYGHFTIWAPEHNEIYQFCSTRDDVDGITIKAQRDEQQIVRLYVKLEKWEDE